MATCAAKSCFETTLLENGISLGHGLATAKVVEIAGQMLTKVREAEEILEGSRSHEQEMHLPRTGLSALRQDLIALIAGSQRHFKLCLHGARRMQQVAKIGALSKALFQQGARALGVSLKEEGVTGECEKVLSSAAKLLRGAERCSTESSAWRAKQSGNGTGAPSAAGRARLVGGGGAAEGALAGVAVTEGWRAVPRVTLIGITLVGAIAGAARLFTVLAFGTKKAVRESLASKQLRERLVQIVDELETLLQSLRKLSDEAHHHRPGPLELPGPNEPLDTAAVYEGLNDETFRKVAPVLLGEFVEKVTRLQQETFSLRTSADGRPV